MKNLCAGLICIFSIHPQGWGQEVSPPTPRKSTFRVYDQRPIYVPPSWETPGGRPESAGEVEFLPGANRGTFHSGERQFGPDMAMTNLLPLSPPTVATTPSEEKEKSPSWLKPGDFLLESDLLRGDDSDDSGISATPSKEDEPAGWDTLQEKLIENELLTPEQQNKDKPEAQPTPQAPVTPNVSAGSGLTLAPVVSEAGPAASRQPARNETAPGLPPVANTDRVTAPTGLLPSVLRMDGVQTVELPRPDAAMALERSRAEFQAVGSRWQPSEPPAGTADVSSARGDFGGSVDRFAPMAGGGRNLFSPPPVVPPVAVPNPLPAAMPVPAFSAPSPVSPPAPALDREYFRPDEYRIRPRGASPSFP